MKISTFLKPAHFCFAVAGLAIVILISSANLSDRHNKEPKTPRSLLRSAETEHGQRSFNEESMPKTKRKVRPVASTARDRLAILKTQLDRPSSGESERAGLVVTIVEEYMKISPEECFNWILSMGEGNREYSLALGVFAGKAAVTNHELWLAAMRRVSSDSSRYTMLVGGIAGLAQTDVTKAWQEFDQLRQSLGVPDSGAVQVVKILAQSDPESFWRILNEDNKMSGNEAIIDSYLRSARFRDQSKAVQILGVLLNSVNADSRMTSFVNNISYKTIPDFVDALYQDDEVTLDRDQIAWRLLSRSFYKDPVASARLAGKIGDESLRRDIVRKLTDYVTINHKEEKFEVLGILAKGPSS